VIVASWLGGDCRQPRRSARRPARASKERKALGPITSRRIAQPAPVVAILEVSAGGLRYSHSVENEARLDPGSGEPAADGASSCDRFEAA
jgi:hypothetical protein